MATPSADQVFRNPGRLIAAPSALTAPYGGTELGATRLVRFREGVDWHPITAPEYGGQIVDAVRAGPGASLAAILRGADDDAALKVWTGAAAASTTSGRTKVVPTLSVDADRPGSLMSLRSFVLMFVPDAPDDYPGLIFYNALPCMAAAAELALSLNEDEETAAVFLAIPDASKRTFYRGLLADGAL
jgi:hypothetical protein